ncbi:MAG: tetratricopeptide repeat protein [Armatimonadota bacterium]
MSACPKCGIQTNEEDRFCRRCGAKLTGRQPSATMDALAEEYRKVVADHPNDADAHYSLGLALLYSERWAEAVIHIERVIELAPAFADAYARLVLCRARLGELDEAWAAVERGLIVDPNHEDLRRLRRQLLDLRGTDDK